MRRSAPALALAVAVLLWGTTFVVSDTALGLMSPAVLTVARFALALLVLAPVAAMRGGVIVMIRSAPVALLGATGVAAYYGLQNLGLVTTGAGTAAVLQAVLPIATCLIAVVWLGERLTRGLFAGLGLATIGVLLVAGQAAAEASPGAALIAAGVIAYAVYTVLLRGQPERDPIVLATATCTWGLIFLLPWLVGEVLVGGAQLDIDPAAAGTLFYLGIVASALTLLLWTYGASRVPASTAGIFTAAIPAVGYLCAIVTGEPSSWAKTAGSALALLGAGIAAHVASQDNALQAEVIESAEPEHWRLGLPQIGNGRGVERVSGEASGSGRVRVALEEADNHFAESVSLTDMSKSGGTLLEGEGPIDVDSYLPGDAEVGNRPEMGRPLLHREHPD